MVKLMLNIVILSLLLYLASGLSPDQANERMKNCIKHSAYGYCRGQQTRWFYDTMTNNCQTFLYSGCGGNINRFTSLPECLDYCTHPEISYDRK
ncbi:PI-actitoxin-Axm2b-like [Drosophila guanche]|uniref:Blast:Papilin n=1 Tax=Drosophila guanche TaxID=7266 RepID=A0A3B0JZ13_DROGU|nr:PI-actitoxin-Axm2b-like [Drosophila guanche]SPP80750.1 blast:Papilin [Drosophila guanche]